MNNYEEYKSGHGYSMFILLNGSDNDLLKAQKEITASGYIIIATGNLCIGSEDYTVIQAMKVQEDGLKEAEL